MSLVQNASTYGHPEILQLLLAAGSEIDAQTFGLTALHFAATNLKEESEDIARILIAAGANLDLQTDEGETALMWTAKFHAVEIMKMLIDGGANLEIRNANNVTVLEFAQCVSDEDYQELLLDAGAKPYTPRPRISDGTEWDFLQFSPECRPVKLIQGMSWEDVNAATGGLLTTRLEANDNCVHTRVVELRAIWPTVSQGPQLYARLLFNPGSCGLDDIDFRY